MSLGRAAARLDSANRGNVIVVDFRRHRPPTDSPGTAIDPCPIPPGFVPTQHALHHGCRSARDPIATQFPLGRASASAWAVLVAGAPTRAPTESVGRFRGGRQAGGALEQSGRLHRYGPGAFSSAALVPGDEFVVFRRRSGGTSHRYAGIVPGGWSGLRALHPPTTGGPNGSTCQIEGTLSRRVPG
jgi:hypothetical protein